MININRSHNIDIKKADQDWADGYGVKALYLRRSGQKKEGMCLAGIAGRGWKQHRYLLVSCLGEK